MVYRTLLGRFSRDRYLHSWNSAGVTKVGLRNIPPRVFSEDVSFGIGPLLLVEQSSLGKTVPRGV